MSADPDFGGEILGDFETAREAGADVATEIPDVLDDVEGVQEGCERKSGDGDEMG